MDIRDYLSSISDPKPQNSDVLFSLFDDEEELTDDEEEYLPDGPLYLEPYLMAEMKNDLLSNIIAVRAYVKFKIGYERKLQISNLSNFMRSMKQHEQVKFGKRLIVDGRFLHFAEGMSQELWNMIMEAYDNESALTSAYSYSYGYGGRLFYDNKYLCLTPSMLEKFFTIMAGKKLDFEVKKHIMMTYAHSIYRCYSGLANIVEDKLPLEVNVEYKRNNTKLQMETEHIYPLISTGEYILADNTIYHLPQETRTGTMKLLVAFFNGNELKLNNNQTKDFLTTILPQIKKLADVSVSKNMEKAFELLPLEAEAYVDYYFDGISVRLVFRYGSDSYNPLVEAGPQLSENGKSIIQDHQSELRIKNIMHRYKFAEMDGRYIQPDEVRAYDFLNDGIKELDSLAAVYYEDVFDKQPITSVRTSAVGVSISNGNILELSLENKEYDFDELLDIINSYRSKKRYHRLKDGRFVTLEEQQLASLDALLKEVGEDKFNDGKAKLPLSKAVYLDSLGREAEGIRLAKDTRFKKVVKTILNPDIQPVEVPESLQSVLRDYQVTGFNWLTSLASYGLGGILADDMGLGKTLQVISFVLSKKEQARLEGDDSKYEPSMVVAPTSLVYNWQSEINKFAPQLEAVVVAGNKASRKEALAKENLRGKDMVITTYNMLQNDLSLYDDMHFSYCFLDEAQHIKNPTTKSAKAAKKLKAGCCFALTGTPIENNLTELWSIFDFVSAGYLDSHDKFRQRFEVPIVREEDDAASKDLSRRIAPFVMRRLKKDVLTELPDKIESRMVNVMTKEQSKLYDAYFVQAKKDFAKVLKDKGFGESRIEILAILTRLRQICCDPSIFLEDYRGGSGKLEMLEEVVADAVENGHRILLFSQFTKMLAKIEQVLKTQGVQTYYLDGRTPAIERMKLVESFNSGTIPVFLISLKAGGTGLNLTGADMVIHYDQWWNPAVEQQAEDRAYRIGQTKNVQVLRFITKDTIEEKIYELQEKKKALIDKMIKPGEKFLQNLSEEEIRHLFS